MSWARRRTDEPEKANAVAELNDPPENLAVEEALKNFRMSVHAWSDAAYTRPRTQMQVVRHRSWRLATGWALAAVLAVGGVSGGMLEHEQKLERARMVAAARLAEQQKAIRDQQAKEEEDLMAKVDSDVSRQVPSAMEPLAQLMDDASK
jgi:hypothetical protein